MTVVTSISYKTDEYEGCKNFMVSNAVETTGDTVTQNTQNKQLSQSFQCVCIRLMTTVATQTHQTCTKPLSLRSACLYQTDGSDFAIGPHTLPIKLNIYTHHTHVLHFCIPQILLKMFIIYKKMVSVYSLDQTTRLTQNGD